MKKRIVIVSGIVVPNPSPPGKITLQFAKMLRPEFDVSIVCMRTNGPELNGELIDGIQFYTVTGLRFRLENYFLSRNKKALVLFMKALGRLQRIIRLHGNLQWFYRKSYNKLVELYNENEFDFVFSICMPFQAHLARYKFKLLNSSTKHITFTVDPFVKGNRFSGYRLRKALSLENTVYQNADYNLVSEEIFNSENYKFNALKDKTESLPYLLENLQQLNPNNYFDKKQINLVYAGNFYKEIRNPEHMLKSLLGVCDEKIILHLFSGGECKDIVESYVEKAEGRFIKHSQVGYKDMIKILNDTDILINVSNNIKEFQPSKTFEYISLGKPIISFYSGDNKDELLARYPLVLQLSDNDNDINQIKDFILFNQNKRIDFETIEEIFKKHKDSSIRETLVNAFKMYEFNI